jgi:hypothetical protein
MLNFEFTRHASDVILEREIKLEWIIDTFEYPEKVLIINDEEMHYIKQIKENENRFLRVVVNPNYQPYRIITIFFDRRIKEI